MKRWYALSARRGREQAFCRVYQRMAPASGSLSFFVPRLTLCRRSRGVSELRRVPLYPGYCLVRADDAEEVSSFAKSAAHPVDVVGGPDAPRPVDRRDQRLIESLMDADCVIGFSTGWIEDGALRVAEGPLRGLEHLVRRIDRHRRTADVAPRGAPGDRILRVGLEVVGVSPRRAPLPSRGAGERRARCGRRAPSGCRAERHPGPARTTRQRREAVTRRLPPVRARHRGRAYPGSQGRNVQTA